MGSEQEQVRPEAKNCPQCGRIMAVVKKSTREGEIEWMWRCIVCDYVVHGELVKKA